MVFWGYTGKYELGNTTLLAQYSGPFNPQEKFSAGVVGRPSRRMHLFAEAKVNPQDQTDVLLGTRLRFNTFSRFYCGFCSFAGDVGHNLFQHCIPKQPEAAAIFITRTWQNATRVFTIT